MKLHILSDLHRDLAGDFAVPATDADLVILAGDIDGGLESLRWATRAFDVPTILVLGNHETAPGNTPRLTAFRQQAEGTKVRVLENAVYRQNGIRFLGCTLWAPTNRGMRAGLKRSIKWLDRTLSEPHDGATVVITHYPPLHRSLPPNVLVDAALADRLSVDLHALIEASDIALWVHGHIHKRQDYIHGDTRIICNPHGYADRVEPAFDPGLVIQIA